MRSFLFIKNMVLLSVICGRPTIKYRILQWILHTPTSPWITRYVSIFNNLSRSNSSLYHTLCMLSYINLILILIFTLYVRGETSYFLKTVLLQSWNCLTIILSRSHSALLKLMHARELPSYHLRIILNALITILVLSPIIGEKLALIFELFSSISGKVWKSRIRQWQGCTETVIRLNYTVLIKLLYSPP